MLANIDFIIFSAILVLLVVGNLMAMFRRWRKQRRLLELEDRRYAAASGRPAPSSNQDWRGGDHEAWGADLNALDVELQNLRKYRDSQLGTTPKTGMVLEAVSLEDRLNQYLGTRVQIRTRDNRLYVGDLLEVEDGDVVLSSLMGNQVQVLDVEDITSVINAKT